MNAVKVLLVVFVVLTIVFAGAFAYEMGNASSANTKVSNDQKTISSITAQYDNQQGAVVLKSAYDHWNYISRENMVSLMSQYASNATLYWIGGALNGTYTGSSSIQAVWNKFFAAWSELWFYSLSQPTVSVNGNISTVTATIQFVATPVSSPQQVDYLNVSYMLKYAESSGAWHIYNEIWKVAGFGVISYPQMQVEGLNSMAVTSAAFSHWDAIAIENSSLFADQYATNATLHWIGGPLTGNYAGLSAIDTVWNKFFSIWSAVWFYTVSPPVVNVSGNVATVMSVNQFVLTPTNNQSQVQYLMINYTLDFIHVSGSWLIYNEIWHITGTGFISFAQESSEWDQVNSLAFTHWNTIAIENSTSFVDQYSPNSTLNWIGGKLSGVYNGTTAIVGVWNKFFTIWSAVWFYSETPPVIAIMGNNAYVAATIQFVVQNASNTSQFFFLNVSYIIHYYNFGFNPATGQNMYMIVGETFQLTGSGPLAKV